MLNRILIGLLLAITPFFVVLGQDTREPKIILALIGAALVSLSVFYFGQFKPVKNKWLSIFLVYIPLCILLSPKPSIRLSGIEVQNFWIWKASLFLFIFSLFIISIYSIDFKFKDINFFFKITVWCGLIMTFYVVLQYFNLDQFYVLRDYTVTSPPPSANLGRALGHPTIVSPFIAMIIPIALYLKKYLHALLMAIVVLFTQSHVAIGAMTLSLLFIVMCKDRILFVTIGILISLLIITTIFLYSNKTIGMPDSGRFEQWKLLLQDIKNPVIKGSKSSYPYTGFGPGSFYYVFPMRHPMKIENFLQAHNEYLELMYDTGLVGLFILLAGIGNLIKDQFVTKINRYRKYLLSSFICIAICAGGTFVWHLGPHIIYTCLIVGLLMKPVQEEELI